MSILHCGVLANLFNTYPLEMALAIAIVLAAVSGSFIPNSILGPPRLGPEESPRIFGVIGCLGLMAYFVSMMVYGAVRQGWYSQHGQTAPAKLSEAELVCVGGGAQVTAFIAIVLCTALLRPRGLTRMGLGIERLPGGIWRGAIGIVIMMPIVLAVSGGSEWLWEHIGKPHPSEVELLHILKNTAHPWLRNVVVINAAIIAPLAEETFFRGCVQSFLRYTLKRPWIAVLLTSLLFCLAHDWWTRPAIFVLAIGLGYLYERTSSLWACVVLHCLFNSASMAYFYWASN